MAGGNDDPGEQGASGEAAGAPIPPVILSVENAGGCLALQAAGAEFWEVGTGDEKRSRLPGSGHHGLNR